VSRDFVWTRILHQALIRACRQRAMWTGAVPKFFIVTTGPSRMGRRSHADLAVMAKFTMSSFFMILQLSFYHFLYNTGLRRKKTQHLEIGGSHDQQSFRRRRVYLADRRCTGTAATLTPSAARSLQVVISRPGSLTPKPAEPEPKRG
jgi:hypothetical protein